ncbi:hypothetical protein [Heliophilum fasciatum]|uniref:Uncharacterized protein n=1 Tax=Heliophilum fasciatum TaxID=35700 RepID=A0A4R2RBR4_9FIRM|nr:hypothetical protein [Heliophilum fasciatum]MCW2279349.1 hypothetical protein [Heliophilum fasciatum]TCP60780.1 hypothetical protein EDD73_13412 [Heliophilum fasciatum]
MTEEQKSMAHAHGHDEHSNGHDAHGHDDHGHDDHGHGGGGVKESPHPWGWVPLSVILTMLLTGLLAPAIAYQGVPEPPMMAVEAQTSGEKEVLGAVENALKVRFQALSTGNRELLPQAFGSAGTGDALTEEESHFAQFSQEFQAAGMRGMPQIAIQPYKIEVSGNRATVVFEYLAIYSQTPIRGGHAWDLAKVQGQWKVVGNGAFIDSPTTSKVTSVVRDFLTAVKFDHKADLRGPWDKTRDPLGLVTKETIEKLAGQGGTWEVVSVTLFGNQGRSMAALPTDADVAKVLVRNADTQEQYLMVVAKVPEGNGPLAASEWKVYGMISEKDLMQS